MEIYAADLFDLKFEEKGITNPRWLELKIILSLYPIQKALGPGEVIRQKISQFYAFITISPHFQLSELHSYAVELWGLPKLH